MLNVLIVDDSLIIRRNMSKIITSLGYKVMGEAKNGQEAVDMTKKLCPDLITMDITMPDMDGITAVKHIVEFNKDVRIIMSTSHGQEQMVLDSIKAGAKGYLLKPISEEKLALTINKVFPELLEKEDDEEELADEEEIFEINMSTKESV